MAGVRAFREAYVTDGVLDRALGSEFNTFDARRLRYDMLWAWYENTSYRRIHSWAARYKTDYGLYKYIRNLHNPAYRLVEFWRMMVWGGALDRDAQEKGAIPIVTENEALRDPIARLWKDSNWQTMKGVTVMTGAALGDVGIKVVDDPQEGRMTLEMVHPSTIKSLELDVRGYVKGYELEEERLDEARRRVVFREVVTRDGEDVVYRTFKGNQLFAWNGIAAEWSQPYGFVPFVMIQHNNVGNMFGWAEIHPMRSKVNEVDDLASKMDDYIRKSIDPVWLFNFRKPKLALDVGVGAAPPDVNRPEPGREEVPALYVDNPNAKAQALVTDQVDIEKNGKRLTALIEEIEREFPELQMDIWTAGGYTTGKALKTARQRVERKVVERRPGYDDQLVRAQQMAIAIGGLRGYEGYEGFGLESYDAGALDHSIPTTRPIFEADELDDIQVKKAHWDTVMSAKKAGLPLDIVLTDLGWSKARVDEFMNKLAEAEPETEPETEPTGPDNAGAPEEGATNLRVQQAVAEEQR